VTYITTKGIDLSGFMEGFEFAGAFIDNIYRGTFTTKVFVEPTMVVFIGTILCALWPSLKVARMKAIDAIKQGGTTN
jgi:ABC-type antimicrobial peptide transport system permease subunit